MDNGSTHDTPRYPPKMPVLKQVFDKYAKESITDEQIQRMLAPVIRKIQDGCFDRQH